MPRLTCPACKRTFQVPPSPTREGAKCPGCGADLALAPASAAKPAAARGSGRSGAARRPAAPQKSPLPFLLGGVGAILVSALVWFVALRGKEEPKTAEAAEPVPSINLDALADQAPLEGTSDEEWNAMSELVKRYVTPPFGPASQQSGDHLMIKGKRSVPAILNGFKRLDLTTQAGAEIGWKVQTLLLQGLCNDTNFGWHKATRPQDVAFNQRVIQRWFESWGIAKADDQAWAEIAKHAGDPAAPAK